MLNFCAKQKSEKNDKFYFTKDVIIGDTVLFSINYINNTSSILNIKEVRFDCSCMSGSIDNKIINPNQTSILSFLLHISNYDSVAYKTIKLIHTDETEEIIKIFVSLKHRIIIKPYNKIIFMNNSKVAQTTKHFFTITNNIDNTILIDSLSISNNSLKIDNSPLKYIKIKQGQEKFFHLSLTPTHEGLNEGLIKIYFPHRSTPITLFVYSIVS